MTDRKPLSSTPNQSRLVVTSSAHLPRGTVALIAALLLTHWKFLETWINQSERAGICMLGHVQKSVYWEKICSNLHGWVTLPLCETHYCPHIALCCPLGAPSVPFAYYFRGLRTALLQCCPHTACPLAALKIRAHNGATFREILIAPPNNRNWKI